MKVSSGRLLSSQKSEEIFLSVLSFFLLLKMILYTWLFACLPIFWMTRVDGDQFLFLWSRVKKKKKKNCLEYERLESTSEKREYFKGDFQEKECWVKNHYLALGSTWKQENDWKRNKNEGMRLTSKQQWLLVCLAISIPQARSIFLSTSIGCMWESKANNADQSGSAYNFINAC